MGDYEAPGLPVDWLNAWLAAIGVTVLLGDVALRWTDEPVPHAVFVGDVELLPERLFRALPTPREIERYAIAIDHPESRTQFVRKVSAEVFEDRAELARSQADHTLQVVATDITLKDGVAACSPFNTPGPGTVKTLWHRFLRCRAALPDPCSDDIAQTFRGDAKRKPLFGLGFDYRRVTSPTWSVTQPTVDPVVECLAFFGLLFFPIRGTGSVVHTRGWHKPAGATHAFTWFAWPTPLQAPAIDALLDQLYGETSGRPSEAKVLARYGSLRYSGQGADTTVGYASQKIG